MKVCLLLLLGGTVAGHSQALRLIEQPAVDTTQLGEVNRLAQHIHLPALPIVGDQRHARFFTAGLVIDFWQAQGGTYQGQVVQWASEVVPTKEAATNREFELTHLLTASTAQALFTVLDSCQILRVPDERAIAGWNLNILDGVSYTLHYCDVQTRHVATYNNPASQGALPAAQLVLQLRHRLYGLTQLQQLRQQFMNAVPYQMFTDGSGQMTARIVTYAQQRAYARDRRLYRRQQAQQVSQSAGKP